MRRKRLCNIVLLLWGCVGLWAADTTEVKKPSVYQGVTLKLDLGAAALEAALNNGRMQQIELAANVRLAKRFYPTIEAGVGGGKAERGDSIRYNAYGGFFRVGCDINPLKRHPESPHALLVGVRIASAFQPKRADCWGEVVLGCQVQIWENKRSNVQGGLYMGWQGRLKIMFTRQAEGLTAEQMAPIYVPGFGFRGDTAWGLSYHIGWKF